MYDNRVEDCYRATEPLMAHRHCRNGRLFAIPDKGEAIRAIKARHPHAAIRVNLEADAELLAKYDVRDGKIFVLVGGS